MELTYRILLYFLLHWKASTMQIKDGIAVELRNFSCLYVPKNILLNNYKIMSIFITFIFCPFSVFVLYNLVILALDLKYVLILTVWYFIFFLGNI